MELKDCPFCHGRAAFRKTPIRGYDGYDNIYIQCNNEKCLVNPTTHFFPTLIYSEEQCVRMACEAWNIR